MGKLMKIGITVATFFFATYCLAGLLYMTKISKAEYNNEREWLLCLRGVLHIHYDGCVYGGIFASFARETKFKEMSFSGQRNLALFSFRFLDTSGVEIFEGFSILKLKKFRARV